MITTAQEAIEDNLVLGQPRPRWKNSDLSTKIAFQSTSKTRTTNEHPGACQ